jgi:soluble P-type ATPase
MRQSSVKSRIPPKERYWYGEASVIEVNIPGKRIYRFENLVLDLNGTITLDGTLIEGVTERLQILGRKLHIFIITADTLGKGQQLADDLKLEMKKLTPGNEHIQKRDAVRDAGSEQTIAVGNGANDALMLREAALGICVAGPEGTSGDAVRECDLLVTDINAALDVLIKPERLIATLRY